MKFSMSRRRSLRQLAAGALAVQAGAALMPLAAQAQGAVTRIVVPFPPGGSTDLLARRIAEALAPALGHPVIVENRAGAGGTVGADYVSKAVPDGHTLLLGVTGSNAIAQSLYPSLPYNVLTGFVPVSMVVTAPLVVSVNPSVKAQTLAEFIALAKARPDSVSFGSAGNGTSMHLTGEMFKIATGTAMVHVPYRGNGGVMTDLMGGQIESTFGDLLVLQPQLEAGKVRALAVTSAQRNAILPNVPTVAESGYPGFEALSWQGVFAPAGTPPAVVERLSAEIGEALKLPGIQAYFAPRGFTVGGSTPQAFKAFVESETAKWAQIVKAFGAKPG